MRKVIELRIWLLDDALLIVEGTDAANATAELFKYCREGKPRFIEYREGEYLNVSQISNFKIKEEVSG